VREREREREREGETVESGGGGGRGGASGRLVRFVYAELRARTWTRCGGVDGPRGEGLRRKTSGGGRRGLIRARCAYHLQIEQKQLIQLIRIGLNKVD
jgi:hypothetical protein